MSKTIITVTTEHTNPILFIPDDVCAAELTAGAKAGLLIKPGGDHGPSPCPAHAETSYGTPDLWPPHYTWGASLARQSYGP